MRNKYLNVFSTVLILGLMILLGAGSFAFGQKGGKGNKGGGDGKPEKHGNGNGDGRDKGRGEKHSGFQRQPQVQVYQNPNVGRTQQGRPDWKQERKAEKHEFRGNRRENRQVQFPQYDARPQIIVPQYDNRQASRRNGRSWGIPWGQYRKHENMERRDDWKADKAYLKELKRQYKADRKEDRRDYQQRVRYVQNTPEFWQRSTYNRNPSGYNYNNRYSGQYDNRYNDDRYDEYNDGVSWKQRLLSTVLSQLVGGAFGNSNQQSNGYGYNQPQYGYNDAQYDQPQYSGYDGGGYNKSGYDAYNPGSFINALPYAEMIDQYSGGLATDMIRQALGMGYDEGYMAGQYARTNGTADDYYSDPYTYPNGSYDGASISLAERRQILSEGYKLGYQDALDGRNSNDYDPQTEGDTNLVSLLLNNVLRII